MIIKKELVFSTILMLLKLLLIYPHLHILFQMRYPHYINYPFSFFISLLPKCKLNKYLPNQLENSDCPFQILNNTTR